MPGPDSLQRHEIPVGRASAALAGVLMLFIRGYQRLLSPLLGPVCRFEPSCSRYGHECLRLHGAFRGSYLAVRRILRCHPFHPGGYDPPPPGRVFEHQSPARHPGEEPPSHGDPAVVQPTPPAL